MPRGVEGVDQEMGVGKELRLSQHAIWAQRARKIINDTAWCLWPPGYQRREYVVAPFSLRNTMEPVADAMGAPCSHDSTGESSLAIL